MLWEHSATGSLLDEVRANRDTYTRVITDSKTTTTAREMSTTAKTKILDFIRIPLKIPITRANLRTCANFK